MIRRPPRSTLSSSSAASDVYKRQLVDAALQSSAGIVPPFVLSDVASSRCGSTCDHDRPQAVVRDVASFRELNQVRLRQIRVQDRGTAFVPANRGQLVAGGNCPSGCNQFSCGAQSLRLCGISVGNDVDECTCCDAWCSRELFGRNSCPSTTVAVFRPIAVLRYCGHDCTYVM